MVHDLIRNDSVCVVHKVVCSVQLVLKVTFERPSIIYCFGHQMSHTMGVISIFLPVLSTKKDSYHTCKRGC